MELALTKAEALVLWEWLSHGRKNGESPEEPALQRVLWDMECQLERELVEPFYPDYHQVIARARETVIREH